MLNYMEHLSKFSYTFKGNTSFYGEVHYEEEPKQGKKRKTQFFLQKRELNESAFISHLKGEKGLGLCPIDNEAKINFAVIDIDSYGGDFSGLIETIYDYDIPLFPASSKSGGLHLFLFLSRATGVKPVKKVLDLFIQKMGLFATYGAKKVEVFPKQEQLKEGDYGNCITLPYFNAKEPITGFLDRTGQVISLPEALSRIRKLSTTPTLFAKSLEELEYSDAPCCIQTIMLTKALEKDDGRNNFLFSCAVYLKNKEGENFLESLRGMNDRLRHPITEKELLAIHKSVSEKEYSYKCNDIPCSSYCDKLECAKREFGIGKDKGYFSGVEYGQMRRYLTEVPYYTWDLRVSGQESWKEVVFKDELSLLDQRYFASLCLRHLNIVPVKMRDQKWHQILNTFTPVIKDIDIPKGTDTSVKAEIREAFLKFLSQRNIGYQKEIKVKLGYVYYKDGYYYFTHQGFQKFLESEKIKYRDENIRELLVLYGAKDGALSYENTGGKVTKIPCWVKKEDTEIEEVSTYFSEVYDVDAETLKETSENELLEGEEDEPLF